MLCTSHQRVAEVTWCIQYLAKSSKNQFTLHRRLLLVLGCAFFLKMGGILPTSAYVDAAMVLRLWIFDLQEVRGNLHWHKHQPQNVRAHMDMYGNQQADKVVSGERLGVFPHARINEYPPFVAPKRAPCVTGRAAANPGQQTGCWLFLVCH